MATKINNKSINLLREDIKNALEERAGISYWGKDGIARTLIDIIANEQQATEFRFDTVLQANQISLARGRDLDGLAESRGMYRLQPTYASTSAYHKNFQFYVNGSFGDINGGADIIIPKGSPIYVGSGLESPQALENNNVVKYVTTEDVTLYAADSYAYASIKAASSGNKHNCAEGALTTHTISGLTGTLYCINLHAIVNGRNLESDDSLRYRLANQYASYAGATETALKLSALEVPGVLSVKVLNGFFGIGTAAVVVFGTENESNSELVDAVQKRINNIQTAGVKIIAIPGVKVSFDFELLIYIKKSVSGVERENLKREIKRTIVDYFASQANSVIPRLSLQAVSNSLISNKKLNSFISISGQRDTVFNRVLINKRYATSRVASEKSQMIVNDYKLEPFEYASVGNITISFQDISGDI